MSVCSDYPHIGYKRPRKVITPSSAAISVVTPENDAPAPVSFSPPLPPPVPAVVQHVVVPTLDYPSEATLRYSTAGAAAEAACAAASMQPASTSSVYIDIAPSPQAPSLTPSPSAALSTPPKFVVDDDDDDEHANERRLREDVDSSFTSGSLVTLWNQEMLIKALTSEVEEMCAANNSQQATIIDEAEEEYQNFFSQNRQPFNLDFYMSRLVRYCNCSSAAFIVMLAFIDRVQEQCKSLRLCDMNCHRVVLTALVLAVKYTDDEVFSNSHYACVGGIDAREMNQLERKMLDVLNWDLYLSPELFKLYDNGLAHWTTYLSSSLCSSSSVDGLASPL